MPGYSQHFRIFVLASGGPEQKDHAFTVDTLSLHIRAMLLALDRLEQHGYSFGERKVKVMAMPARQLVGDRVAENLGGVAERGHLDHAYYSGGLRYQIWVSPPDGPATPLIDGGVFDWLARITSNRRAVYLASGTGADLIALRFRTR